MAGRDPPVFSHQSLEPFIEQTYNNKQGCGVAAPLDAILFCRTTKEYAEKGAQLLACDSRGFPPFHCCFEDRQKLGLKPSDICRPVSQTSSSILATSHGKESSDLTFMSSVSALPIYYHQLQNLEPLNILKHMIVEQLDLAAFHSSVTGNKL